MAMGFAAAILRKSPSLVARFLGGVRASHYATSHGLFPLLRVCYGKCNGIIGSGFRRSEGFGSFRYFSVASDSSLLGAIDAEIQCAIESEDHEQVSEIPDKFPFEIKDDEGKSSVVLTRNFHGEKIEVVVSMPGIVSGDYEGVGDDQDDNNVQQEDPTQSSLPLIVRVSKGDGPGLEFSCTAYADEVTIDALSVRQHQDDGDGEEELAYEGPEFSDLDENLQKAFHKYLEIRGISPATTNFLHEYMINKDSREYLVWMRELKKFIAN